MDIVIFIIEILGTVAFAVSGVIVAKEKHMDVFGVCMLGITTGCGGGVIRDIIIGHTPPMVFVNPIYALVALVTSLVLCLPILSKHITKERASRDIFLQVFDAVGLGGFTVVAVVNAYELFPGNIFLMVFVGCVSGCGGGVLRDIFAGTIPFIFRKHIYASASIAGALLCSLVMPIWGSIAATISGLILVVVIRFLASYFRLNFPRMNG